MKKPGLSFPSPRQPKIPQITSVEQLLPRARHIVKSKNHLFLEGLELKLGEKVLALVDSTLDPLVLEALTLAIREAGGHINIINLEGHPKLTDPVELVDTLFSRKWFPDWVWNGAKEADVFIQGVFLKTPYVNDIPIVSYSDRGEKPRVVAMEWDRNIFVSDAVNYPVEIRDAIDRKTWEILGEASRIDLNDPEGTNISFELNKQAWLRQTESRRQKLTTPYLHGHLDLPLPTKIATGVLATSNLTFGGPVDKATLHVEGGHIINVEGIGKFSDTLRQSFERYRQVQFPGQPGPGANWIWSLSICTNPKSFRSPTYDKMSGSGRMHAWAFGHRRSGVIHIAIGRAQANPDYQVIRFFDIYFATLLADGKKVIDTGHLVALDDPEVRKIAEKYGDPEQLLTEDWIPAIRGVNVD